MFLIMYLFFFLISGVCILLRVWYQGDGGDYNSNKLSNDHYSDP
jgi:hypothetical protein